MLRLTMPTFKKYYAGFTGHSANWIKKQVDCNFKDIPDDTLRVTDSREDALFDIRFHSSDLAAEPKGIIVSTDFDIEAKVIIRSFTDKRVHIEYIGGEEK